jgi:CofH subfamily radical SAM domain protein
VLDAKVILEGAVERGEISAVEALILLEASEEILPDLYDAANVVAQRMHHNVATYIRSKKIHYTNVCRAECKFCTFFVKKNDARAFVLPPEEVARRIGPLNGIRQIEVQGGIHPDLGLDYHLELLRAIRAAAPKAHIHGYSPVEIWHIARKERTMALDVLRRLREAGLGSMPGDGAVILNDKLRKKIAHNIPRTFEWQEVCRAAHKAGIATTATILFGHIEDEVGIGEHLETIKQLQKKTHGFAALTIVPFLPDGSWLAQHRKVRPRTPDEILRVVAVARLHLGKHIPHIQVEWTKVGFRTAIRALAAGANDLGGLSFDAYEIVAPGTPARRTLELARLRAALERLGRIPMERGPFRLEELRRRASWRPSWQRTAEEPILV